MLETMQNLKMELETLEFSDRNYYYILSNLLNKEIERQTKIENNKKEKMKENDKFINEIIELLKENQKGMIAREIATEIGVTTQKVTYLIKLIENIERKPDNKVYRYFIINE